jgi:electron transport complex protein RnfB
MKRNAADGLFTKLSALGEETLMDPVLIKAALGGVVTLGCIGLFFGIGLAMAAHKFHVEPDPKVEEVLHTLAGAQ